MDTPFETTEPRSAGLGDFAAELERWRGLPLVFNFEGREISAGYHITEVKAAEFQSIDCGGAPERWRETVIQLWDVDAPGARHMSAGKFLGILEKASRRVETSPKALLKFELGGRAGALRMYAAGLVAAGPDRVSVRLEPVLATCKPMFRDSATPAPRESGCCAKEAAVGACCA